VFILREAGENEDFLMDKGVSGFTPEVPYIMRLSFLGIFPSLPVLDIIQTGL
jgi:hypothetical protein